MDLVRDDDSAGIAAADEAFFGALLSADTGSLEAVLADDFVTVDVMSGRVTGREEFLAAMGSGMLRFAEVTRFSGDQSHLARELADWRTDYVGRVSPGDPGVKSAAAHNVSAGPRTGQESRSARMPPGLAFASDGRHHAEP